MKLWLRRLIGATTRPFCLNFTYCGHCGRPWKMCRPHITYWNQNQGCFPLCEDCWKELTIEERVPYYIMLVNSWGDRSNKAQILDAVWAGK